MHKLTIGVSGINAGDNLGPGIGVARSLREASDLDVTIVGLAYDPLDAGNYMDWVVDRSYIVPYPSAGGPAYLARLEHIREASGLDIVIPCLDAELPLFISIANSLRLRGTETFLPNKHQFRFRGKDRLSDIADAISLRLPRTAIVHSEEMLEVSLDRIGLPVMVKGIFYEAHRARTAHEAASHYHEIAAKWGYPIVVQELIDGDEVNVVGLGDGHGEVLGLVGMRKMAVTSLGKVGAGVTVNHPELLEAARRFCRDFRWKGPFELECMIQDGEIFLIEINPRFPAWTYFATGVGVNLPSLLVRCCLGQPVVPRLDYPSGKMLVRYSYEIVAEMGSFQSLVATGETP